MLEIFPYSQLTTEEAEKLVLYFEWEYGSLLTTEAFDAFKDSISLFSSPEEVASTEFYIEIAEKLFGFTLSESNPLSSLTEKFATIAANQFLGNYDDQAEIDTALREFLAEDIDDDPFSFEIRYSDTAKVFETLPSTLTSS